MIRGISFGISQPGNNSVLWDILKCIDTMEYTWFNIASQNEVWSDSAGNNLFDKNCYSGNDFCKQIKQKQYIIFLKLQAYSDAEKFSQIHTYEDFLDSKCCILLLIHDSEFVEIYCKEDRISKKIYEHAILEKYKDIKYITDRNDNRTVMDVL